MSTRAAVLLGLAASTLLALGQIGFERQEPPPVREALAWEPYSALGNPPYDRPVLLQVTAYWCAPCREMKLTTFRDPQLAEWVRSHNLRLVRAEEKKRSKEEFEAALARYGGSVPGVPTFLLLGREGEVTTRFTGYCDASDFMWKVGRGLVDAGKKLRWYEETDPGAKAPGRLTVRLLNNPRAVSNPMGAEWVAAHTPVFAQWMNTHFNLVTDYSGFGSGPRNVSYYREHEVALVPTLLVFDPAGREIARFQGTDAVKSAPLELTRLARERGYEVPDPPAAWVKGDPGPAR